jgi:hypothetical protein
LNQNQLANEINLPKPQPLKNRSKTINSLEKSRLQTFQELVGEFRPDTIKNLEWVVSKTEGKLKAIELGPNDSEQLIQLQP